MRLLRQMKIDEDCKTVKIDLSIWIHGSMRMKHQWPMIEASGMTGEAPGASTASLNVLLWSCQGSD